jgi:hypothetical protein
LIIALLFEKYRPIFADPLLSPDIFPRMPKSA